MIVYLMQVTIHTGDAWGQGCTSKVSFEVVGTHGRLQAADCRPVEVHATTDKREKAVQYALSLAWPSGANSLQIGEAKKVP